MKISRQVVTYKRLRDQSLWKLLASDNAPIVVALLQNNVWEGDRRVPQSILHERIERDLEELRSENYDVPQRAQGYVADWLTAGYLERHFPPGAAEEEYEISASAAQAIRFILSVSEHRNSATESRLSTVIHQLTALVEETDANPTTRINALLAERNRIDEQIRSVQSGNLKILNDVKALERIRDIITLSRELIGDFRYVRDKFAGLNRELREKLMDDDDSRAEVLDALFEGVDLISESEAGRTFEAFWQLLTDPEQNKSLEEALDVLSERSFFIQLNLDERQFLRRLVLILLEQGGMVHDVLQNFARSLKNFVQSREYLEHRHINQLLNEAQRTALMLRDIVGVAEKLEFDLPLTSCRIRSLAQLSLLDPSLGLVDTSIAQAAPADISLSLVSDLVAQSEINFRELRANIRTALSAGPQVSIGELVAQYPVTQGLGTVIGYMSIGSRHGLVMKTTERISWDGQDAITRRANIPLIFFTRDHLNDFK